MLGTIAHPIRGAAVALTASVLLLAPRLAVATEACVGDCSKDGEVTVNELIAMVNVALGSVEVSACMSGTGSR